MKGRKGRLIKGQSDSRNPDGIWPQTLLYSTLEHHPPLSRVIFRDYSRSHI